jgi:hypothetical protein
MKIIFGYDIVTYNGPLPNCLDPKFYNTIKEGSDYIYDKSRDYFIEKWGVDYCVFNSNDYDVVSQKKSVYEILKDKNVGKKYKWFYIIEPHSGLDQFFGEHKIHNEFALNFISKPVIEDFRTGQGCLLINYTIDGGIGATIYNFSKLFKFIEDNNIPHNKVYLVFADYKLKETLKNIGVNYNIAYYDFYMKFKSHEFNKILSERDNSSSIVTSEDFVESIGTNKKDFLLLTRHWKLHRLILLSHLHKIGLENSLVSWDKSYYNHNLIHEMNKFGENPDFEEMIKTSNRTLDVEDITKVMGIGFENKEMYLNTYMSIVTESLFFSIDENFPVGFLSEKIWKPVGHCQPFILAGPSNSLKHIRETYGYKTFHPYIDESYDDEHNDQERIKLIIKEIDRFSNKTKEEKDQFLRDVKEICIFNQNKFLEYGKDSFGELNINNELNDIVKFFI